MALQARSAASRGMGLVAECFLSLSLFWLGLYQACCAAVASAQRVGVPVLMARPSRHSACAPVRDAHAASGLPAALQAVRMPGATPAHLAATLPPPPPTPPPRLQPVATALFANSPFKEGKPTGYLSWRSHVWTDTDPDR